MEELKNPKLAIPVVLMAGIFWSFGPYVVRHIDQAHTVPWQYLFTRGITIFILLNLYLFMEEGIEFINNKAKKKRRKNSHKESSFIQEYNYEIVVFFLFSTGIFLLLEKMKIKRVIFNLFQGMIIYVNSRPGIWMGGL